jgi:hypothetical protein
VLPGRHGKLLARVPVTGHSEQEWGATWESRCDKALSGFDEPTRTLAGRMYRAANPYDFPYNDLFGFVEVYWDGGNNILGEFYFLGDARRRPGKIMRALSPVPLKSSGYFRYRHRERLAWLMPGYKEASEALVEAFDRVEDVVAEQRGHVDLDWWRELYRHVDLSSLLART